MSPIAMTQLEPSLQNDGAHRVTSDPPVGVLALGWDVFVSYGDAAGTQLEGINLAK